MSQASVTGRHGVQIEVHAHGVTLAPLNIEPAKDLWAALGRAIDQAEQNRDALVGAQGKAAAKAIAADDAQVSQARDADAGVPEGVASAADMPDVEGDGMGGTTDFTAMTKDELHSFLEASGVDAPASAKKGELVKMAEAV